jgi:hypothetical protein
VNSGLTSHGGGGVKTIQHGVKSVLLFFVVFWRLFKQMNTPVESFQHSCGGLHAEV